MNSLEHLRGADMGTSFSRIHFVNDARKFFKNLHKCTTNIVIQGRP